MNPYILTFTYPSSCAIPVSSCLLLTSYCIPLLNGNVSSIVTSSLFTSLCWYSLGPRICFRWNTTFLPGFNCLFSWQIEICHLNHYEFSWYNIHYNDDMLKHSPWNQARCGIWDVYTPGSVHVIRAHCNLINGTYNKWDLQ